MTTKTFATRDSATSLLRKIGINSRDYNLFITVGEAAGKKTFTVEVAKAERHVAKGITVRAEERGDKPKQDATTMLEEKNKAEGKKIMKQKKASVSSVARQMILDGATNKEVWIELERQFKLDGTKKHYPSWYRSDMKRKGLIK